MTVETFFKYWGKASPEYPSESKWHPLVYHSLDVASVAAAWWKASSVIQRIFRTASNLEGFDDNQLRAMVLFFISLHDIGKFDVRFQLKACDVLDECWPGLNLEDVDCSDSKGYEHGAVGYWMASKEHKDWFGDGSEFCGLQPWMAGVTGHHGELPDMSASGSSYPAAKNYVLLHDRKCRVPLIKEEQQVKWLLERLNGIAKPETVKVRKLPPIFFYKQKEKRDGKLIPVLFEGLLRVENSEALVKVLEDGIGPAKGFGCGLMLVKRI